MTWKFYCPHCKKIKNWFQVARGTDGIRFYWYRCRECGKKTIGLREALEDAISAASMYVDDGK